MQANDSDANRDDDPAENIENLLHDAIQGIETAFDELPPNEHVGDARLNAGNAEGKIQDAIQILNEARDLSSEAARDASNIDERFGTADRSLDEARSMLDIARDELERLEALQTPTATVTVQMGPNTVAYEVEPPIPTDNREAVMNVVAHTVAAALHQNPAVGVRDGTMSGGGLPQSLFRPPVSSSMRYPYTDEVDADAHPAIDAQTYNDLADASMGMVGEIRAATVEDMVQVGVPRSSARAAKLVYGGSVE